MMDVGSLRDRIQLQTYTEVQDPATSGTLKTWTTIATLWANLSAVTGYVTFQTQQISEKVTHKIILRYYSGMSSEYWVLFNNRRFRIRNVMNIDERNIAMQLLCEEVFQAS